MTDSSAIFDLSSEVSDRLIRPDAPDLDPSPVPGFHRVPTAHYCCSMTQQLVRGVLDSELRRPVEEANQADCGASPAEKKPS